MAFIQIDNFTKINCQLGMAIGRMFEIRPTYRSSAAGDRTISIRPHSPSFHSSTFQGSSTSVTLLVTPAPSFCHHTP
ncbi:unnamed protein product [Onchocerca flexuosa]|uniref:Uncharacterized protein n=1 Tax=Onchocerca flexuosa TaxID=387005 RepID=A0A183HTI8_9BILA|nr:unnamed protein product [Onchocerca flexuosa]